MQGGEGGDLSSLVAALPTGMTPRTTFLKEDLVMIIKGGCGMKQCLILFEQSVCVWQAVLCLPCHYAVCVLKASH